MILKKKMNDEAFVQYCYKMLLNREADDAGTAFFTNELKSGKSTREKVLLTFINCDEYKLRHANLEFVPSGHFYSAIPSSQDREEYLTKSTIVQENFSGIDINKEKQISLLSTLKPLINDCPFPENKNDDYRYYFNNPAYSYTDALMLQGMLRHFKPKRVIEIGSGFSSCAMLDVNDLYLEKNIDFTFIEPYPELLTSLMGNDKNKHRILASRVQDINLSEFKALEENDILFIDSTHVSKLNSDVNFELFEILPNLNKGVIIHFHDILWPFDYPKSWIKEGRAWNEAYLLRAFLSFNQNFEILFFADYMRHFHYDWIAEHTPLFLKNTGGNLWLKKVN